MITALILYNCHESKTKAAVCSQIFIPKLEGKITENLKKHSSDKDFVVVTKLLSSANALPLTLHFQQA